MLGGGGGGGGQTSGCKIHENHMRSVLAIKKTNGTVEQASETK